MFNVQGNDLSIISQQNNLKLQNDIITKYIASAFLLKSFPYGEILLAIGYKSFQQRSIVLPLLSYCSRLSPIWRYDCFFKSYKSPELHYYLFFIQLSYDTPKYNFDNCLGEAKNQPAACSLKSRFSFEHKFHKSAH